MMKSVTRSLIPWFGNTNKKTLVEGVLIFLVACVLHIPYVFNATV
jgi:hypothetical protein